MKVSDNIAITVDRLPTDFVFTYSDFDIQVSSKDAVVDMHSACHSL